MNWAAGGKEGAYGPVSQVLLFETSFHVPKVGTSCIMGSRVSILVHKGRTKLYSCFA